MFVFTHHLHNFVYLELITLIRKLYNLIFRDYIYQDKSINIIWCTWYLYTLNNESVIRTPFHKRNNINLSYIWVFLQYIIYFCTSEMWQCMSICHVHVITCFHGIYTNILKGVPKSETVPCGVLPKGVLLHVMDNNKKN